MSPITAGLCFGFALSLSAVLSAGQIYGTIVADSKPVKDTDIEIKCGEDAPLKGKTASDGAYRINVPKEGQCTLTLPTSRASRRRRSFPRLIQRSTISRS